MTRRRVDLIALLVGSVLLVLTSLPIDADSVSDLEADAFRLFNDLTDFIYPGVWVVMQLGNFLITPIVALAALIARRVRLAVALAASGTLVWLLAKVIKVIVERGRPAELLDNVVLHGDAPLAGKGYVSGHAAVAVALATVAAPHLGRRWRTTVWILAGLVCLARVYVGAHLPLDSVGGAAFGWAVGSLVNLAVGVPAASEDESEKTRT
jgi:membrane-associated phospholipid phosphatase